MIQTHELLIYIQLIVLLLNLNSQIIDKFHNVCRKGCVGL